MSAAAVGEARSEAPGRPPGAARVALSLLVGLLAFVGTAGLVRARLAPVPVDELEDKLAHLAEHGHEYSALILGASGTFHGIDPTVFDAELQAVRPGFRSFNLGARGMLGLETDAVLRRALPLTGDALELVVLEPKPFHPWTYRGADEIARVQRWHTPLQTARAVALSVERARRGEPNAWAWAWQHLRTGIRQLANFGAADRLLDGLAGAPERAFVPAAQLEQRRGYLPIEFNEPPDAPERRARFLEQVQGFAAGVAAMLADGEPDASEGSGEPQAASLTPRGLRLARDQRAWLQQRGLRVVYLMPPYVRTGQFEQVLGAAGIDPDTASFADPRAYPELYALEARLDTQHLTASAAAELSRLAGRAVARLLERDPPGAER